MTDARKWPARDPGNRQPCPDCRADDPCPKHCGARIRQLPDALCLLPKGKGTDHVGFGHCDKHLGGSTNHRSGANVEKARRAVADLALPVDIHPHVALMQLMAIRWGEVEYWQSVVAGMESMQDLKQTDMTGRFEKPSVFYEMRDAALTAAQSIAKTCHDVGIEERRQRVAEEHGHEVATMLRNVTSEMILALTDEGIPAEVSLRLQRDVIPRIVQAQLRQLMAGGDVPGAAA